MAVCFACHEGELQPPRYCSCCGQPLTQPCVPQSPGRRLRARRNRPSKSSDAPSHGPAPSASTTDKPVHKLLRKAKARPWTQPPSADAATERESRPSVRPVAPAPILLRAAHDGPDRPDLRQFPERVDIRPWTDHNFFTGFTGTLSDGGLFVATYRPLPPGEEVEVVFTLPELDCPCAAVMQVQWVRDYNPDRPEVVPGMGLRFVRMDARVQAAIERFMAAREPLFYVA